MTYRGILHPYSHNIELVVDYHFAPVLWRRERNGHNGTVPSIDPRTASFKVGRAVIKGIEFVCCARCHGSLLNHRFHRHPFQGLLAIKGCLSHVSLPFTGPRSVCRLECWWLHGTDPGRLHPGRSHRRPWYRWSLLARLLGLTLAWAANAYRAVGIRK